MGSDVFFYGGGGDLTGVFGGIVSKVSEDLKAGHVGIKVHFGEGENDTHVKAEWLRDAGRYLKNPVFVECNVLYKGDRTTRETHVETAKKHGFDFLPIDILDSERGEDQMNVEVNTKNTNAAKLGGGLAKYDNLVSIAHFKGHIATGFGGALKNVGMGLASRGGKMDMHSIVAPTWEGSKCKFCGLCAENCAEGVIDVGKNLVVFNGKCVGCARCIAVCPTGAITVPWHLTVSKTLMEKVADYALAATKGRRWWFVNFLTNITYDCDCMPFRQMPFMKDVGLLLSRDPVAVDQASLDLVVKENGGKDPFAKKHGVDGTHILEYAEKIGLGSRKYRMIRESNTAP